MEAVKTALEFAKCQRKIQTTTIRQGKYLIARVFGRKYAIEFCDQLFRQFEPPKKLRFIATSQRILKPTNPITSPTRFRHIYRYSMHTRGV